MDAWARHTHSQSKRIPVTRHVTQASNGMRRFSVRTAGQHKFVAVAERILRTFACSFLPASAAIDADNCSSVGSGESRSKRSLRWRRKAHRDSLSRHCRFTLRPDRASHVRYSSLNQVVGKTVPGPLTQPGRTMVDRNDPYRSRG